MKKTKALELIAGLRDMLNEEMLGGGNLVFTNDLPVGIGLTPDEFTNDRECLIGTAGLGFKETEKHDLQYPTFQKGVDKVFRNEMIEDRLVTHTMVSCGHEFGHNMQQEKDFHGQTDNLEKAKYLGTNFVACMGNSGYYEGFGNLFQNPRDIDAEKTGINLTYSYIADHEDPSIALDMIVDYLNYRTDENHTYYFYKPREGFHSIEQINKMFDEAFEASKSGDRYYFTGQARWEFNDMNAKFLDDRHDDYARACVDAMASAYGAEKDKLMAAVSLKQDPSYERYVTGLIRPEELSMKKVFSPHFTEEQNERFFKIPPEKHEEKTKSARNVLVHAPEPEHRHHDTDKNLKPGQVPSWMEDLLAESEHHSDKSDGLSGPGGD